MAIIFREYNQSTIYCSSGIRIKLIILGIDPGKTGALAVINKKVSIYDIPICNGEIDIKKLDTFLFNLKSTYPKIKCFVEKSQAMPNQGIVSTGNYMKNYGIILGLLTSNNIIYTEVRPQIWKKKLNLIKKDKTESIKLCKTLIPGSEKYLKLKKHHNRAEALLIAYVGANSL